MKKTFTLIRYFSKSLFRHNATPLFLALGLLMLVVAFVLSDVNIVVRFKLFEDVLLTSQMFLLHMAALFYAFELLGKDASQGLYVLPLSTGLRRERYLFALAGTLCIMVLWLFTLFACVDVLMLWWLEGAVSWGVVWQLWLYALSAMLLCVLVLTLSQFVYVLNAVLYGVALFIIGSGLDELYVYAMKMQEDEGLKVIAGVLFYGLPNFSFFDYQSAVVNRAYVRPVDLYVFPVLYFLGASGVFFALAAYAFSKKALRVGV